MIWLYLRFGVSDSLINMTSAITFFLDERRQKLIVLENVHHTLYRAKLYNKSNVLDYLGIYRYFLIVLTRRTYAIMMTK